MITPIFNSPAHAAITTRDIVERITAAYSYEDGERDGICYWPDALPAPGPVADPLILFRPDSVSEAGQPERIAVVPMEMQESATMAIHSRDRQKPSMQIPLGLIDKPELLQREILLVDLQGPAGSTIGNPLLIIGAKESGKATALQTSLLWLAACYSSRQLRCALIDPLHELETFQYLPHLYASDGTPLWTDGVTDERLNLLAEGLVRMLVESREACGRQPWDDNTVTQLWSQGIELPLLLLIICHYDRFMERPTAAALLKRLVSTVIEARPLGAYAIITAGQNGLQSIPPEVREVCRTRIGLWLDERQRYELFGHASVEPERIAGRGLVMMPGDSLHEIQLALPVAGATEAIRQETLKAQVLWLAGQLWLH